MSWEALSAELERAALRALAWAWQEANGTYFKHKLKFPVFALSDTPGRLGLWRLSSRTMELQRRLVADGGWGEVLEVLRHEMAHQYVHEVLGVVEESAHGPAFQEVCARLGIDGAASGMPGGGGGGGGGSGTGTGTGGGGVGEADAKVRAKISKLFALAGSPNQHEAALAMAEAQRLMLKHNLDSVARGGAPRGYGFLHLGKPVRRVEESQRQLAALLMEHFFVRIIWVRVWDVRAGKAGTVMEACGTPGNLEMASWVHAFMNRMAEQLWLDYRKQRKAHGRERRTFQAGVMLGFQHKLRLQAVEHEQEGLVWVKDPDLDSYYRRRHPYVRTTRTTGNPRTSAHADGRNAGGRIVLHKPVGGSAGPGGGSGRRLLGR